MNRAKTYLVAAMLFLVLANASSAFAGILPGILEGTGTNFEITDSSYLNISVNSSEEIKVLLQSVPEMVTIYVEPVSEATSTTITISGFAPNTTYYKYEDSHRNLVEFTTDGTGSYTYEQDLSQEHLVFIQTHPSTIFLTSTGWEDDYGNEPEVGTWDPITLTGALTTDINYKTIEIDDNGITLNGAGHVISGLGSKGIHSTKTTGITMG